MIIYAFISPELDGRLDAGFRFSTELPLVALLRQEKGSSRLESVVNVDICHRLISAVA